ncbi:hypothetical protein [Qipengyuania pacifica]|uniref:hypothetical protein n=1 Tax=Qipengyuania pacifica TaxID=2860199 RepID=UPI001C9E186B|nr:hypothetical protein [Qipengyuania pacifica]MBY8333099.1 hypothetical protein [Qipengyuania pacifica]
MRNTIIKRASRALLGCGITLDAEERDEAIRAVLEAIREPTDDMLTAAAGLPEGEGGPTETWQAMIDAALAEE